MRLLLVGGQVPVELTGVGRSAERTNAGPPLGTVAERVILYVGRGCHRLAYKNVQRGTFQTRVAV